MKKKNKVISLTIIIAIIISSIFYYNNYKKEIDSSYGKEFKGIPVYEGAKIIQDDVKESEEGNTQGIRSYLCRKYKGDLDNAVNTF